MPAAGFDTPRKRLPRYATVAVRGCLSFLPVIPAEADPSPPAAAARAWGGAGALGVQDPFRDLPYDALPCCEHVLDVSMCPSPTSATSASANTAGP